MDRGSSIAVTIIYAIAARQWYFYCLRIYNRLYCPELWVKQEISFENEDDDPLNELNKIQGVSPGSEITRNPMIGKTVGKRRTSKKAQLSSYFFGRQRRGSQRRGSGKSTSSHEAAGTASTEMSSRVMMSPVGGVGVDGISYEGYITKKGGSGVLGSTPKWTRRYFVLSVEGELRYYKDRRDFLTASDTSLKEKPILVALYEVSLEPPSAAFRAAAAAAAAALSGAKIRDEDDSASVFSEESVSPMSFGMKNTGATSVPEQLFLIPSRAMGANYQRHRVWELRFDTMEDRDAWLRSLSQFAAPASGSL